MRVRCCSVLRHPWAGVGQFKALDQPSRTISCPRPKSRGKRKKHHQSSPRAVHFGSRLARLLKGLHRHLQIQTTTTRRRVTARMRATQAAQKYAVRWAPLSAGGGLDLAAAEEYRTGAAVERHRLHPNAGLPRKLNASSDAVAATIQNTTCLDRLHHRPFGHITLLNPVIR